MRKDKKQAGRDLTNEKKSTPCSARGQFVPLWAVFREKTEKRTGRDASNGKTREFPLSHGEVQRGRRLFGAARARRARRAVAPFYRCVVAPVVPSCPSCRRARRAVVPVVPSRRFTVVSSRPSERASGGGCSRNGGAGESGKKKKEKTAAGSLGFRLRFCKQKNTLSGKTRRIPAENRAKRGQRIPAENPGKVTLSFYCRSCGCGFPNRNPRN